MIVSASSTAYSTANFTADWQREEGGCCQHRAVQIWAKSGLSYAATLRRVHFRPVCGQTWVGQFTTTFQAGFLSE
jgi:hypothetical protein